MSMLWVSSPLPWIAVVKSDIGHEKAADDGPTAAKISVRFGFDHPFFESLHVQSIGQREVAAQHIQCAAGIAELIGGSPDH
jgi:hypothetical protein